MPIVAKIGVTGGPAGGKTYFTTYSKEHFMKSGLRPVYASEVATLFESYGIGPMSNVLSNLEYQYMIAKYQFSAEEVLINSLEKSEDNILLILDRTIIDGKAYCSEQEWKVILERLNKTEQDLYERYDLVLHFVTTAVGKFSNYSTENNPARHESVEQAAQREQFNVVAYNGMPINKKVYLNNDVDMESKQRRAVNIVLGYLKMAKPIFERQEKYLVRKISKDKFSKFSPRKIYMSQDYLSLRNDELERRVRCVKDGDNNAYYYTEKNKDKSLCSDRQIKLEEYYSYLKDKKKDSITICKERWYFQACNLYFQYDEFEFWDEFAILEVQPTNICSHVLIPEEFEVIGNITILSCLFNNYLAERIVTEEQLKEMFDVK